LRFDLGQKLAQFDLAMRGFENPAAHRAHRWDLTRAEQHRDRIALVDDPQRRALLGWAFAQWTKFASPVLPGLRAQFIHGDPNPENILVQDGRVTGLVDFGDCCWNPVVCELAICLTYQMMNQDDPWSAARPVIAGFTEVLPLSVQELQLLPPLICSRLANTVCVAAERHRRDPGQPNWFVSVPPAWRLLDQLRDSTMPGS
jgi:Ser/Thr protein kinase RdoA (MazF antagonist)